MKTKYIYLVLCFSLCTICLGQANDLSSGKANNEVDISLQVQKNLQPTNDKIRTLDSARINLEERMDIIEQKNESQSTEKSWFEGFAFEIDIFSVLISFVFSVIIVFFAFMRYLSSDIVSDSVKNYIRRKIDENKTDTNSLTLHNNRDFLLLKKEFEKLQNEMSEIRKSLMSQKNVFEWDIQNGNMSIQSESCIETQNTTAILYLSTPNVDGSFNESSAKDSYHEGASIYKFTKITNDRAKFEIDDRLTSIRLALQYPTKNIDPVCNSENSFTPSIKNIRTLKPGVAERDGDKWIVTNINKAKIKYE